MLIMELASKEEERKEGNQVKYFEFLERDLIGPDELRNQATT